MHEARVDVVLAGPEHAEEVLPLVRALNELEGITWRPEAMGAALARSRRRRAPARRRRGGPP